MCEEEEAAERRDGDNDMMKKIQLCGVAFQLAVCDGASLAFFLILIRRMKGLFFLPPSLRDATKKRRFDIASEPIRVRGWQPRLF